MEFKNKSGYWKKEGPMSSRNTKSPKSKLQSSQISSGNPSSLQSLMDSKNKVNRKNNYKQSVELSKHKVDNINEKSNPSKIFNKNKANFKNKSAMPKAVHKKSSNEDIDDELGDKFYPPASSSGRGKNAPPTVMPIMRKKALPLGKKIAQTAVPPVRVARDPRFDDLSGRLDAVAWSKNYKFLEGMRNKEKRELIKQRDRTDDPEERKRIQAAIQRIVNQEREKEKQNSIRNRKKEERKAAIDSLNQGFLPTYQRKSELKLDSLLERYQELTNSNTLDKYLKRKEKQIKSKEMKEI